MIPDIYLESFCHRVGMSVAAGLSILEAIRDEIPLAPRRIRPRLRVIADELQDGVSIAQAMRTAGGIPPLVIGMSEAGEATGRIEESFLKLADHYGHVVRSRRLFIQGVTWPMLQCIGAAVVLMAMMIALAYLQRRVPNLHPPDLIGLGWSPMQNAALIGVLAALAAAMIVAGVWLWRSGRLTPRLTTPLRWVPVLGKSIRCFAVSRFAWAFGSAIDAGIDAATALRLGLTSSQDAGLRRTAARLRASIERGDDFHTAMRATGAFDPELLRSVQIGERTGQLTESLQRLSERYEETAVLALRRFGQLSGLAISLAVVLTIGGGVVAMYANYMTMVNDALQTAQSDVSQLRALRTIDLGDMASMQHAMTEALKSSGAAADATDDSTPPGGGPQLPPNDNPIIATRDAMVKDFVENNEDFKQLESIYSHLGRYGSMTPDEFLDGIGGDTPAVQRYKRLQAEAKRRAEERQAAQKAPPPPQPAP